MNRKTRTDFIDDDHFLDLFEMIENINTFRLDYKNNLFITKGTFLNYILAD